MKFYISSSNQGAAIKLANAISRTGGQPVISESYSEEPSSVISDISNNADEGTLSVVICSNPIKMALAANKTGYFNAVSCNTAEDFTTALQEGANLVVLQDEPSLISEIAGSLGSSTASMQNSKKPLQRQQKPIQKASQTKFELPFQKKSAPQPKDDSKPLWDKDKGIKKNLKNIFGIE